MKQIYVNAEFNTLTHAGVAALKSRGIAVATRLPVEPAVRGLSFWYTVRTGAELYMLPYDSEIRESAPRVDGATICDLRAAAETQARD